jgi:Skp family chaperone for outer membrane proteins
MKPRYSPSASAFFCRRLPALITAACAAALLCPSPAAAAERQTRIGVVDTRKVLDSLLSWGDTLEQLEAAEAKMSEVLKKEEKDIRRMEAELRYFKPDSEEYDKRKAEVGRRLGRLRQRADDLSRGMAGRSAAAAKLAHREIAKAVANYAAVHGFELVVDARAVLYVGDGRDIGQEVAREMNKRYKGSKAAKEDTPQKDK